MGHLSDALCTVYDALGFDEAAGGDVVFRQLVLARINELASMQSATTSLHLAFTSSRWFDRQSASLSRIAGIDGASRKNS
jgi:hypothetical protein